MKQLISLVAAVVIIVGLVVFGFTLMQVRGEQEELISDLERRTALLADSFKETIRPSYLSNATTTLQIILNKFANRERLLGLVVYDNKAAVFATSAGLSGELIQDTSIPEKAMDSDSSQGDFVAESDNEVYIFATPVRQDEKVVGALAVFQRSDYIKESLRNIWRTNLLRLLVQSLIFSLALVLILRWIIYRPIMRMAEAIRAARTGKAGDAAVLASQSFFKPIASEISKMSQSLVLARTAASEEARLRLEKIDSAWTAERLKEFFKVYLKDRKIFVVSNREPYIHQRAKNKINIQVPASGMVTAIEPILAVCGGVWLAHGSGDADREVVDKDGKISVPPDDPKYTLKRVWLTEKEVKGYYVGFANEALWPLCLMAHNRPIFRKEDWETYRKVNGKFAQTLLSEIKDVQRPVVMIQDYHFALLPAMIQKSRPDAEIGLFWHIPWPSAEGFSICPWRKEILEGMLGADVLGFHTQQYCNNFLETVGKEVESLVDLEKFAITHEGHTAYIKPFPISVPFAEGESHANEPRPQLLDDLEIKTKYLGLGVDRLDYTKGILEKFKALEFFFTTYPSLKEQFTLLQIAPPSREEVEKYREFNVDVTEEVERINRKFGTNGWKPIILLKEHFSHEEIYPLYRAADVCLVTSLSDGMNLVAKEFVAARSDDSGTLILSQFTGASRDLTKGAIIVNPYSAEQTSEAIYKAITMPAAEQRRRMKKMREAVKDYNIYRWAAEFLKALTSLG